MDYTSLARDDACFLKRGPRCVGSGNSLELAHPATITGSSGAEVANLEDHPRICKWLGSPPFISQEKGVYKGNNPTSRIY